MEPNTPKISHIIPILSLLFLNSISPSLSDLPLAPEISPAPQPSSSNSVPDEDNPFLENICKSTDYPNLCIDTISPFLKGKSDIISVLDASMNAGLETTNQAILLTKQIIGTSPDMVSILSDCKNSFEDAKENFEKAIGGLPIGDIGLMNSMLSAVITDVSDCEDGYAGSDPPLSPFSEKIVNMTSNCLAIASLVPDHMKYVTLG